MVTKSKEGVLKEVAFPKIQQIKSGRLILRKLKRSDAKTLFTIFNDANVTRFDNNFVAPYPDVKAACKFIKENQRKYKAREPAALAIVEIESGLVIGQFDYVYHLPDHQKVCVAYHFLPEYWGRGYATEALRTMINWLFTNTSIHRIEASCDPANLASERVMQKAGMTFEGLQRDLWFSTLQQHFCSYTGYAILSTDPL